MAIKNSRIQRLNKNAKGKRKCARNTSQKKRKCTRNTSQRNRKYVKCISLQYRKPSTSVLKRDFNSEAKRRLERIQQLNQRLATEKRLS